MQSLDFMGQFWWGEKEKLKEEAQIAEDWYGMGICYR